MSFKDLFTYKNLLETLKQTANAEQPRGTRDDDNAMKETIDELIHGNNELVHKNNELVNKNDQLALKIDQLSHRNDELAHKND